MSAQADIQKNLPATLTDTLSVSGGAIASHVLSDLVKPKQAGKTNFMPIILIILGVLFGAYVKGSQTRLFVFGLVVYQILAILFKKTGFNGGLKGFGQTPEGEFVADAYKTIPLTYFDDSFLLEGLGCPDCGNTCHLNNQPENQPLEGCPCNNLGFAGVESYLSAAQIAQMRANCPGLESKILSAINTGLAQGKTLASVPVTVNVSAKPCSAQINFAESQAGTNRTPQNDTNPSNINYDNISRPEGTMMVSITCKSNRNGQMMFLADLLVWKNGRYEKVNSGYSQAYVEVIDATTRRTLYTETIRSGNVSIFKDPLPDAYQAFARVQLTRPDGATFTIESQTNTCNPDLGGKSSSVLVSDDTPTTTPPSVTAPTAPLPDYFRVRLACAGISGLNAELYDTRTNRAVFTGNDGFGTFEFSAATPANVQVYAGAVTVRGLNAAVYIPLTPDQAKQQINVTVRGTYNGQPFTRTGTIAAIDPACRPTPPPPPAVKNSCLQLISMGLNADASAKMSDSSCANLLKLSDIPERIAQINCSNRELSIYDQITVSPEGAVRHVKSAGGMSEPIPYYRITAVRLTPAKVGESVRIFIEAEKLAGTGSWVKGIKETVELDYGNGKKFSIPLNTEHTTQYENPGTYTVTAVIRMYCEPVTKSATVVISPATPPPPPGLTLKRSYPIQPGEKVCNVTPPPSNTPDLVVDPPNRVVDVPSYTSWVTPYTPFNESGCGCECQTAKCGTKQYQRTKQYRKRLNPRS